MVDQRVAVPELYTILETAASNNTELNLFETCHLMVTFKNPLVSSKYM